MIEVIYLNGIKEKRNKVFGDEMKNPRIKDTIVYGGTRTHTKRIMECDW